MTSEQIIIAFIMLVVWTILMLIGGILEKRLKEANEILDEQEIPKAPPSETQKAFDDLHDELVKLRDILLIRLHPMTRRHNGKAR